MRPYLATMFAIALFLLAGGRADAQTPERTRVFRDFVQQTAAATQATAATTEQFASGGADALVVENALLAANPCLFILVGHENGPEGLRHTAQSGLCPSRNHGRLATVTVTFATFCRECVSREVWLIGDPTAVRIPQGVLPDAGTAVAAPVPPVRAVVPSVPAVVEPPSEPTVASADASVVPQVPAAVVEATAPALVVSADASVQVSGEPPQAEVALLRAHERDLTSQVANLTRERDEARNSNALNMDERRELSNLRDRLHGTFATTEVIWICAILAILMIFVGSAVGYSVGRSKNPKHQRTVADWQEHLAEEDKKPRPVDEEPIEEFDFAAANRKSAEEALGAAHTQALESLRQSHANALKDLDSKHAVALAAKDREIRSLNNDLDGASKIFEEQEAYIARLKEEKSGADRARDQAVAKLSVLQVNAQALVPQASSQELPADPPPASVPENDAAPRVVSDPENATDSSVAPAPESPLDSLAADAANPPVRRSVPTNVPSIELSPSMAMDLQALNKAAHGG